VNLTQFGKDAQGMQLFLGQPGKDQNNKVNWQVADTAINSGIVAEVDTVKLFSDSMGMCNADRFLPHPNFQNFSVSIEGVTLKSTDAMAAYAVYDQFNGMWPMSVIKGNIITEDHVPDIPLHFVVIAVIDGNFYGGITAAVPANGQTYKVTLSKTDPAEFRKTLNRM
jgi:hypothetical protein